MKRRLAFEWSCDGFGGSRGVLFLWTFTFREVLAVDEATRRWDSLQTMLRRDFPEEWQGFRAFEVHPRGHGLHIHAVIDRFIRWERIQRCSDAAGFGRINVKAVPVSGAKYLAKYLGKQQRCDMLKNKRLAAPFGQRAWAAWTRIKDVVRECRVTRTWALLKALVPKWAELSFWKRRLMVANALFADLRDEPLNEYLHLGIQPVPFLVDA